MRSKLCLVCASKQWSHGKMNSSLELKHELEAMPKCLIQIGTEVSGQFGTSAELSYGHFGTII